MSITKEQVINALSHVDEPDLNKDLVTLNMIEDVRIEGKEVAFSVVLSSQESPSKDMIYNACVGAIHHFIDKDIDVNEISPKLLDCTNLLEKKLNDFLLIKKENNKRAKLLAYEKKLRKRDLELKKETKEAKEAASLKRIQARNDKLAEDAAKVITVKKKKFKSK